MNSEETKSNVSHVQFRDIEITTIDSRDSSFSQDQALIEKNRDRYPTSIVWTPLPGLTTIFPFIGHVGICTREGVVHDFSGTYNVSVDNMAFGRPQKLIELNPEPQSLEIWDEAIERADARYKREIHNLRTNNCHSYVASVLNLARYKGRTDWTMIDVWFMTVFKSQFIGPKSSTKTFLGFLFFIMIVFLLSSI